MALHIFFPVILIDDTDLLFSHIRDWYIVAYRHDTMGQDPEKIDLSRFESWDLFQNDQHKFHFTLDIAVSMRNCAVSLKLVKTC